MLLATVALFIATKERWNWLKIVRRLALAVIVIALAAGASIILVRYLSGRPHRYDRLNDIELHASRSEVRFLKGEPVAIYDSNRVWEYTFASGLGHYKVGFAGDQVQFVFYDGPNDWPPMTRKEHGVAWDVNELVELLGRPSAITNSDDGLARIYCYDRYNLFFAFREGTAYWEGIFDPTKGCLVFRRAQTTDSTHSR